MPSNKNPYNLGMNILRNLLFSFQGKIGRADYIYAITYVVLLFFVSIDAFVNPNAVRLIWGGIDYAQLLVYGASLFGMIFFIWSFFAVTVKRARALNIDIRLTLVGIVFPPLLLIGFKKDSETFTYQEGFSFVDRAFFYVLLLIVFISLFTIYEISLDIQALFFILVVIAGIAVYFVWVDKSPFRHGQKVKYSGIDAWIDLGFVLVIVFFIRSYIFSPFQIIGPSMESTFHGWTITYAGNEQIYSDGEFILVDKLSYRFSWPKRGDVIVFTPGLWPEKRYLIKRVIGLPGEKIKVENGYIFVATKTNPDTFVRLDESEYLGIKFWYTCLNYTGAGCSQESQTFTVPEGRYFLMGDNRPQSLDSRKCFSNSGCMGVYRDAQFVRIANIQWRVAFSLGHFDVFSQILPYPKLGTLKSIVPFRGLNILNKHTYNELLK